MSKEGHKRFLLMMSQSLKWFGYIRERGWNSDNTTLEAAMSETKMPQYMDITPIVLAYTPLGDLEPRALNTHKVRFSMN